MATMVLTIAGSAIGGYFGGPYGAMAGGMIGGMIGGVIDQTVLAPSGPKVKGPRLTDLLIQNASYGQPIARVWGQVAIAGNLIWQRPLKEVRTTKTQSSGGKGGSGPSSKSVTYSYYGRFAVGVCEGPIASFGRIWADGKLIRDAGGGGKYNGYFTFYTGTETQAPDPTMQSYEGVGATPAYRGLAYVVATDLPLADFGNRIPNLKIEVITKAGAQAAFDSDFIVKSTYLTDTTWPVGTFPFVKNGGHSTDKFGNFIINGDLGNKAVAFSPAGATVWTLNDSQMADLIEAYVGGGLMVRDITGTPDFWIGGGFVAPILGGEYLLMTVESGPSPTGGGMHKWVAILDPVASGVPAVKGAVHYRLGSGGGIPWGFPRNVMVCGAQTELDPILLQGHRSTDYSYGLTLLPSADEIATGVYAGGWGPVAYGWEYFEVPCLEFTLLGGADFARNLYHVYAYGDGNANPNKVAGFALPLADLSDPSQPKYGTNVYVYLNKTYVQWCLANGTGIYGANPEVKYVIGPAHPDGCMVCIPFPPMTFAEVAFANLGIPGPATPHKASIATPAYGIDDANWQQAAGGSALPFTDEWHYLTDGSVGGSDYYSPQPALIEKQPDGSFLVVFAMLGMSDMIHSSNYTLQRAALRLFLYSPLTGVATQFARLAGAIYEAADFGWTSLDPNKENHALTAWHVGSDLYLWGDIIDGATYLVKFGTISLTADIGLDEIVGDLCAAAGLEAATDYDVTPLASQRVRGYAVGRESDARAAIEPLQQAFFFDGVDSDGKVKWAFRAGAAIASIAEADLAARSGGDAVAKVGETRKQDHELPQRMIVKYVDVDRDFQAGAQQAKRIAQTMGSRDQQTADVPIVMTAAEAIQVAQKGLYLAWIMRTQYAIALPLAYLRYDPADVLTLTWNDGGTQVPLYVTEIGFGADGVLELKGAGTDEVVYLDSTAPGSGSVFIGQSTGAIEAATLALMDLAPLRDADDDLGFYYAMAGASDAWRGGALYRSADGVTYAQVATSETPTPMGFAITALPSGPTTVHDDANTVTVRLSYGALESVTRALSLNGANAALLGDEILTFDTATPLGGADWQLSGLLRGRKGTEWAVGAHLIGERFVRLDAGSIGRAFDTAAWRNAVLHYKGVSAGLAVASAAETLFTDTGASLKPYSPVGIAGSRDGSDNLTITWIRRARRYAEWTDGVDVPLDEPAEAYELDVLDGGTVVRTITGLSAPTASYSAAEQTTDFGAPQASVAIAVYQISSRVGRGFAGQATV